MSAETPLMKQYNAIKAKHPDALLLFRVGDFYETFGSDAITASDILGIVLTKRKNGAASSVELAGFPHHALDTYLPKLVRAGKRVAICDQLEDPKQTKKIVKRGITELVTPGLSLNDNILDHKSNNFLAALHFSKDIIGAALLDLSTGEFYVTEGNQEEIETTLAGFQPNEILYNRNQKAQFDQLIRDERNPFPLEDWVFTSDFSKSRLLEHFKTKGLKGFGIDDMALGQIAAGAILHYLSETHHKELGHVQNISRLNQKEFMWLDPFTIRNLELFYSNSPDGTSLLDIMDQTKTAMGSRMLKRWMGFPLTDKKLLESRLSTVAALLEDEARTNQIGELLGNISDVERLTSKLAVARINPKEMMVLLTSLDQVNSVKDLLIKSRSKWLKDHAKSIPVLDDLVSLIRENLADEPPLLITKGNVIREGISSELDELRTILTSGKDYLVNLQQRESESTGIPSLKIGFNNVFGYYLEVTNSHKDKVPSEWHRKQTLVNSERYITEELKEYEQKILGAEEKIISIEQKLYMDLISKSAAFISSLQENARAVASIDCVLGFAELAKNYSYTKPEIHLKDSIEISSGRHPVIEACLTDEEEFIPNDLFLDQKRQQILMITGPNMSGKSAILRQTALITLMAHMGSYVPAKAAKIALTDKIFTRVGASDNLSQGESTFMVEMNETASILNNLSDRSLILLDEIGRGTSTYDGISIAWAIAEYLHDHPTKAKTLFATHYHELNDMSDRFSRIQNFNVSIREVDGQIIFLRKLIPGGSEHSFGIHVAKLAGMPAKLVLRADEILKTLEKTHADEQVEIHRSKKDDELQLSFFQLDDPTLAQIKDEISNIEINTLTPVEALFKLNEIKKMVGK